MEPNKGLAIVLVLHDYCRGWIIEKMADKLCGALRALGVDVEVRAQPSAEASVNHFMIFHYVDPMPGTLNTVAVTHIDDALKIDMVRKQFDTGVRAAICMSSMTVDQVADDGVYRSRLTYVVPAHDVGMTPERIVIGITSNNYSDGRKRDWLLGKLAVDLRLDDFEFRIFGGGWDEVCRQLEGAGAVVVVREPSENYRADYEAIKSAVPNFDYYFYPGLDEGSLGTLDALSVGVKTIVTTQGFHLDVPNGITHGFWDYDQLKEIFEELIRDRHDRIDVSRMLTWRRYAQKHLDIWTSLIEEDVLPSGEVLNADLGLRTEPRQTQRYPVKNYLGMLGNRYRRDMILRFWLPSAYQKYLNARGKVGRIIRGWKGRAR